MEEGARGLKKSRLRGDMKYLHTRARLFTPELPHVSPKHGSVCTWSYNSAGT